jgi:hypothetical protein
VLFSERLWRCHPLVLSYIFLLFLDNSEYQMVGLKEILAAGILFATAKAAPAAAGTETLSEAATAKLVSQFDREFAAQAACTGQSCAVADFSGSSGIPPRRIPEGGKSYDFDCVTHYSPAAAEVMNYRHVAPVEKQPTGLSSALLGTLNSLAHLTPYGRTDYGHYTGSCATNILIFARGTLESGLLGTNVGPALTSNLPSSWTVVGVAYDANIPGTFCLGLPGGSHTVFF